MYFHPSHQASHQADKYYLEEGFGKVLEHTEVRKTNEISPQQISMNYEWSLSALEPGPTTCSVWANKCSWGRGISPPVPQEDEEVGRSWGGACLEVKGSAGGRCFLKMRTGPISTDQEKWGGEKKCVAREAQDLLIGETNCNSFLISCPQLCSSLWICTWMGGLLRSRCRLICLLFLFIPSGMESK